MRASAALESVRGGRWVPYYEPRTDPIHRLAVDNSTGFRRLEVGFWALALVFDVLDLVTTWLGVGHPGLIEGVPFSRWVLEHFGFAGLLVEHVGALVILAVLWYILPKPYRLVVPGQFTVVGAVIVAANLAHLAAHGIVVFP